jgi:hypothetical protein
LCPAVFRAELAKWFGLLAGQSGQRRAEPVEVGLIELWHLLDARLKACFGLGIALLLNEQNAQIVQSFEQSGRKFIAFFKPGVTVTEAAMASRLPGAV